MKNRGVAILLAVFLGGFGAHKFYLGRIAQGLLYLLLCWTFIPALISIIEAVVYASKPDQQFAEQYR